MAIAGLTNRSFNPLGRIEVTAFKGTRKKKGITKDGREYEGYGEDLNSRIRLTTDNKVVSNILSQNYGKPDGNGDFLTESLRIYLPFDEVERTFATSMSAYKGSGLEVMCDRTNILKKCVMLEDKKGQYRSLIDVQDTPCPMAGKSLSMKCQHGCTAQGQLFFYVKELLDSDLMIAGKLTLHSYEDVAYIDTKLREFEEVLGTITNSDFPCSQYRHKIPFILSRTQVKIKAPIIEGGLRTGKKGDRVIWAMSLTVDPQYMKLRRAWMEMQERVNRQLPVSQSVVKGLLRGDTSVMDYIDVESEVVEPQRLLPPVEAWKSWKSPEDAIAYAREKLPFVSEDRLWQEFDNLEPINGKKAPAWFSLIESAVAQQKYVN
jgi:hypothetical protein